MFLDGYSKKIVNYKVKKLNQLMTQKKQFSFFCASTVLRNIPTKIQALLDE